MFGADRGRSAQPTTAQVVTAVVNAPSPVDASQSRRIAPAPDPSSRPRPIGGGQGHRREPAGVSIFGGRVYELDAIAAQSIMPREIPGVVTNMPAPIGPPPAVPGMMPTSAAAMAAQSAPSPPAWREHPWRSIFGNRIDSQHLPPWHPDCPPAKVAATVDAMLPPAQAAQVKAVLARTPPHQRAAAWRSIFGNRIVPRNPGMGGWHGHYYTSPFRGFSGLIGFGG